MTTDKPDVDNKMVGIVRGWGDVVLVLVGAIVLFSLVWIIYLTFSDPLVSLEKTREEIEMTNNIIYSAPAGTSLSVVNLYGQSSFLNSISPAGVLLIGGKRCRLC